MESAVNEMAQRLHMDPVEIRLKNMVREGDVMPAYYGRRRRAVHLTVALNGLRS